MPFKHEKIYKRSIGHKKQSVVYSKQKTSRGGEGYGRNGFDCLLLLVGKYSEYYRVHTTEHQYESTSQFNREYRRLFGIPPAKDAATLREAVSVKDQKEVLTG